MKNLFWLLVGLLQLIRTVLLMVVYTLDDFFRSIILLVWLKWKFRKHKNVPVYSQEQASITIEEVRLILEENKNERL